MLNELETTRLEELEKVIQKGIDSFITVGHALLEIKEAQLWRKGYDSFDSYCKDKWGFGKSHGYYLIGVAEVAESVGADTGATPHHLNQLKIIKDDAIRKAAWEEAKQIATTADDVKRIAQKHIIMAGDDWLAAGVRKGQILPQRAFELKKVLSQLPPYYNAAMERFGVLEGSVDPETVSALRRMEHEFKEEVLDILRSGYLFNGYDDIPLHKLSPRDVFSYQAKLRKEVIAVRQEEVREQQKQRAKHAILDGSDIYELHDQPLAFIFPEGAIDNDAIAKELNRKGYEIMLVIAYRGDAEINFDIHNRIPVREINGVKPVPILEMIERL